MTDYFIGNPVLRFAYGLLFTLAAFNVVASVLTIVLIVYMRNWKVLRISLYLEMVIAMTVFQALYDSSFFLSLHCSEGPCAPFYFTFFSVTGVTSALWSMLIVCSVGWIISSEKLPTVNFMRVCWLIVAVVFVGILVPIQHYMRSHRILAAIDVYNYARLTIVVVSVFQVVLLYLRIYRRSAGTMRQQDPLYHLVRKLVWYSVIQVISRLGGSMYTMVYARAPIEFSKNATPQETLLLFMFCIFTPSAGIGCAVVFCSIQKGAWICFKRMMFPWVDYGPLPEYLTSQRVGRISGHCMDTTARVDAEEDARTGTITRAESLALLDEEELTFEVVREVLSRRDRNFGGDRGRGIDNPLRDSIPCSTSSGGSSTISTDTNIGTPSARRPMTLSAAPL